MRPGSLQRLNDTWGHQTDDKALATFSLIFTESLRRKDVFTSIRLAVKNLPVC
ncbi:diguanylate cyclase domain-containing protein [Pseudomonas sp. PH1b]|uniref:diguanylate cyclase domain-containing protein n=1 Tax=Pseudomonas sp. PH1b TaxID=1397282 RepID=UPI000E20687E